MHTEVSSGNLKRSGSCGVSEIDWMIKRICIFKDSVYEDVEWTDLAQNVVLYRARGSTVMDGRLAITAGSFLAD